MEFQALGFQGLKKMFQIAPISPIGVSIPFQNRSKLHAWCTRKNADTLAVYVSKKLRRLGNCCCQRTDRVDEIIGEEINGQREPGAGLHEEESHIEKEAWNLLRSAVVNYYGSLIGTIAAKDPTNPSVLNYDQVFVRDFIPSGVAFMLKGEPGIVRNYILHTLQLQVLRKIHQSYAVLLMVCIFF